MASISPGYYSRPKGNLRQWQCKIWGGVNKVHYGLCEKGEFCFLSHLLVPSHGILENIDWTVMKTTFRKLVILS